MDKKYLELINQFYNKRILLSISQLIKKACAKGQRIKDTYNPGIHLTGSNIATINLVFGEAFRYIALRLNYERN